MNKKGLIIIISGPSGVGKKTIIDQFINDTELNLSYSVSMTTREPREGEMNGVDYFFVSDEEFTKAIENNELLEWAEFAKNKYGTPLKKVYEQIEKGKNVILEIEVKGATDVIKKIKREDFVSIFIIPPSIKELKRRLKKRDTEDRKKIRMRIKRAKEEIKMTKDYDHVVLNDDATRAAIEMKKIILGDIYRVNKEK
ncbi:guanylate kinase [Malacoplasma iowae]|nr:guanylate kinase [Malacoplasma iowae]WPL39044.1 guanylate kinase [Malacoplasma iowae]WPL39928.1 guanylate kinase [Malacoplasma iowae]VEU63367.1 guanylate kinase [Mycoplasmopsis fermentans]VEU72088.1 guanylate kinase [Malacoplasma iowae]